MSTIAPTYVPTWFTTQDRDASYEIYTSATPDAGAFVTLTLHTDWAAQICPGSVILSPSDARLMARQLLMHASLLEADSE